VSRRAFLGSFQSFRWCRPIYDVCTTWYVHTVCSTIITIFLILCTKLMTRTIDWVYSILLVGLASVLLVHCNSRTCMFVLHQTCQGILSCSRAKATGNDASEYSSARRLQSNKLCRLHNVVPARQTTPGRDTYIRAKQVTFKQQ
jgi:hypothetical protein